MSNEINEPINERIEDIEKKAEIEKSETNTTETTSHKCAFCFPKFSEKEKRQLVKHGMVASLAITALSGFLPIKYSKSPYSSGIKFSWSLCYAYNTKYPKKEKISKNLEFFHELK